jgi:hypothetical protein
MVEIGQTSSVTAEGKPMDRLRAPFFWLAGFMLLLALLIECASGFVLDAVQKAGFEASTPGLGISYLPILDGLLLYTVLLMGLGILLSRSVIGRIQGIVTLVLAFFGLLGAIAMALVALGLLILMVTLLVAVPFGTIAYFAAWADFPTGAATATLGLILLLKIAFCILLVLAHERFLQNKGIVILSAVSLGATLLVSFLIDFPPGFLASIADAIGALIIAVVGAIWLLILLIGSILATISSIRTVRV